MSEHDSPLVVLIWLIVQLGATVLMSALSIFHFVRLHPTSNSSCVALANLSAENDANYTNTVSVGPTWELSAVSMSFILVSLIITVVDATINMHKHIHQVPDRGDAVCKNAKQLFRVYYCWTLRHIILITVAANTNKWSWQTDDDLDVLSHTAVFFLACIIYLLLVVAIFTRHAYGCIWTECKKSLVPILTTGLIISHISSTSATLVVLFSNEPDLDCLSRIAVGIPVAVYVLLSSSLWLLSNCLAKESSVTDNHCYAVGITTTLLVFLLSVGALVTCVSLVQLSMNHLKRLSLLLFSLPLIPWLVLFGFLRKHASSAETKQM